MISYAHILILWYTVVCFHLLQYAKYIYFITILKVQLLCGCQVGMRIHGVMSLHLAWRIPQVHLAGWGHCLSRWKSPMKETLQSWFWRYKIRSFLDHYLKGTLPEFMGFLQFQKKHLEETWQQNTSFPWLINGWFTYSHHPRNPANPPTLLKWRLKKSSSCCIKVGPQHLKIHVSHMCNICFRTIYIHVNIRYTSSIISINMVYGPTWMNGLILWSKLVGKSTVRPMDPRAMTFTSSRRVFS